MNTYKIQFEAVKLGAIGKPSKYTETFKATDFDKAVLMIYCNYEHVRILKVNGETYNYK